MRIWQWLAQHFDFLLAIRSCGIGRIAGERESKSLHLLLEPSPPQRSGNDSGLDTAEAPLKIFRDVFALGTQQLINTQESKDCYSFVHPSLPPSFSPFSFTIGFCNEKLTHADDKIMQIVGECYSEKQASFLPWIPASQLPTPEVHEQALIHGETVVQMQACIRCIHLSSLLFLHKCDCTYVHYQALYYFFQNLTVYLGGCSITESMNLAQFFFMTVKNCIVWLDLNSFNQCLTDGHSCLHCYSGHACAYTFAHICKCIDRIDRHFLESGGIYAS